MLLFFFFSIPGLHPLILSSGRARGLKALHYHPVHALHFSSADWIMTISTPVPRQLSAKKLNRATYIAFFCPRAFNGGYQILRTRKSKRIQEPEICAFPSCVMSRFHHVSCLPRSTLISTQNPTFSVSSIRGNLTFNSTEDDGAVDPPPPPDENDVRTEHR